MKLALSMAEGGGGLGSECVSRPWVDKFWHFSV